MKTTSRFSAHILVALLLSTGATIILAQGTAITYQGGLNVNGTPISGVYDMRFTAYDALSSGNVIGGPLTNSTVNVSNGLFTTSFDFGDGVFTGPPRWLQIDVRTNGIGSFVALTPRQPLTAAPYAIYAGNASNVVNGAAVKSLNNLRDNVALAAGANVSLATNGNTLTISSTGPGGAVWSLSGANTYYNAGNVGIGTTIPAEKLTIAGISSYNNGLKLTGSNAIGTGMALENTSAGGHNYALFSAGALDGVGAGGFGVYDETAGAYRLAVGANGNVGIGTYTPQGLLDLFTGSGSDTSALFVRADPGTFGRGGIIHHQSSTFGWQELAQKTGSPTDGVLAFNYVDRNAPGTKVASAVLALRGNGCVGIGTEGPETKLTVFQSTYGIEHTDGSVRLATYLGNGAGWLGTLSNHRLQFFVNDGGARMTIDTVGNVGIGTTAPGAKLDVAGDAAATRLILRADPLATANAAVLCADPGVINFVPYNTATARPLNLIARDATVRVLTITGGADIAEPFQMSPGEIAKGSVVVIDQENPGQLKLSTTAYDSHVAGVVSGANGVQPGLRLHQEGTIEGGENVALSGRVYVQADAAFGDIKPGDLLTTSETPGHAMKVKDHLKAQGAILGKAMTPLKEGRGMVLVLVSLQ